MTDDTLKEQLLSYPKTNREWVETYMVLCDRLHAVEQERDAAIARIPTDASIDGAGNVLFNAYGRHCFEVGRTSVESSLGPPVPACPRCQMLEPEWEPDAGCWSCVNCMVHFDEPTYYRQVKGQP